MRAGQVVGLCFHPELTADLGASIAGSSTRSRGSALPAAGAASAGPRDEERREPESRARARSTRSSSGTAASCSPRTSIPTATGIGSEVALALWLTRAGKTVAMLNDSVVPAAFAFLARAASRSRSFEPELAEQRFAEADALVVLDTSNRQRIGRLAPLLDRHVIPIAVVDHHVSHANGFGQVNVIEPEASATGEIVYELIRESGGDDHARDRRGALRRAHDRHRLVPLLEHRQPRPPHGGRAARPAASTRSRSTRRSTPTPPRAGCASSARC